MPAPALRVLVVDTYYPAFQEALYSAHLGLSEAPYETQLGSLIAAHFGTSGAYSRELRALGHEAEDVIVNCLPLQRRWAIERGSQRMLRAGQKLAPDRAAQRFGEPLLHAVAHQQVADFEPDVVYLQDLWFFTPAELARLRDDGRLVVGQIASAPPPDRTMREYDLVTTSFPHFVERFRGLGIDSEYLRIAFDPEVLDRLRDRGIDSAADSQRRFAVSFVGGLSPGVHGDRVSLFEELARAVTVDAWGYGAEQLDRGSPLLEHFHGESWGLDMYGVLAESKIVVNRHIESAEGNANNMRLFEATGAGALLVTDAAANLSEMFEPGREVVTYDGLEDLVAKVRHFSERDEERIAIARAGQARTLAQHTYGVRIPELAAMLERRLAKVAV